MTLEEYVRSNGYEMADLTPDEIEQAKKENEVINNGGVILDGVFSDFTIALRKVKKEAGV